MERSLAALERPRAGTLADPQFAVPESGAENADEDHHAFLEAPGSTRFRPLLALAVGGGIVAAFLSGLAAGLWWGGLRPI